MQHEVTRIQKLLDRNGHIGEPGWARKPVWQYCRWDVKAPPLKIKEWDYYMVLNKDFGVAVTFSDLGYMGMACLTFLDFVNCKEHTETVITPMPRGRFKLGTHSAQEGQWNFNHGDLRLRYTVFQGERRIQFKFHRFYKGNMLKGDILLEQPRMDTMCIATPWKDKPTAFYYNQKINCMPAKGKVTLGDRVYRFNPNQDFGMMDWGRGVWPHDNVWYWGTASARYNGKPLGFNLGYGFSDRSSATENLIIYDGKAHKLDEVMFNIPRNSKGKYKFMEPWTITSNDGRFEMDFNPILDRKLKVNLGAIVSDQHQVFGYLKGTAVLDNGAKLKVQQMMCPIEVIHNKY